LQARHSVRPGIGLEQQPVAHGADGFSTPTRGHQAALLRRKFGTLPTRQGLPCRARKIAKPFNGLPQVAPMTRDCMSCSRLETSRHRATAPRSSRRRKLSAKSRCSSGSLTSRTLVSSTAKSWWRCWLSPVGTVTGSCTVVGMGTSSSACLERSALSTLVVMCRAGRSLAAGAPPRTPAARRRRRSMRPG